jgi:hypothetical protein
MLSARTSPAPAKRVTDAMVERAVTAYFDRPDWVRPGNQETVPEQMRRVLTAALGGRDAE